jgi:GNAT superfamily N-acetyltransferase
MPDHAIRPARSDDPDELERLRDVERRAGELFIEAGMPEIAADDPPSIDELRCAAALLVAVRADDQPVGYARIEVVDGHAHLEQLSVDPAVGRQGIGSRLLDAVAAWASERGDDEVTLTTFREVAFNAPYYRRRGFEVVEPADRPPGLAALVAAEAAHGLDPDARVTMRRVVPSRGDGGTSR